MAFARPKPLKIIPVGDTAFFSKNIKYKPTYTDEGEKNRILDKVLLDMYEQSYLTARFADSIKKDTSTTIIKLYTGSPLRWAKLSGGNVDEGWLSLTGYQEKLYLEQPFSYKQVKTLLEKLLSFAENNGYPFATIRLKDVKQSGNHISASLFMQKNKRILWDSIEVVGDKDTAISRSFLRAYLGIKPGTPYSEKAARAIRTRLREVLYIKVVSDPQIVISGNKAKPRLFIEEQKANRLDGVLGLAPNSSVNNSFMITGELNLALQNILGEGIQMALSYKTFLKGAQQINVNLQYPFLLGLPFSITEDFNLLKYDTAYYTVDNQIGINYNISGPNYFRVFFNNTSTHLLNAQQYESSNSLPPNLDISTNWYGIGLHLENLDYKFNPRKGYTLQVETAVGVKDVSINPLLKASLYDSIHLHKVVERFKGNGSLFIPVGTNSTFNLGFMAAILQDNEISQNQLYRIGGLHDLRGFDEQSIVASSYVLPYIEYRYLVDKNSNLQLFYNAAFYRQYTLHSHIHDIPMGFGTGYNYLTKAGMFSINFAVGKQLSNSFDFSAAKVHIGYLNRF